MNIRRIETDQAETFDQKQCLNRPLFQRLAQLGLLGITDRNGHVDAARHGRDHELAMHRMQDAGATITTVESVLFEWLSTADRPEFKAVSKIITSR